MSLLEWKRKSPARRLGGILLLLLVGAVTTACTVRPLYMEPAQFAGGSGPVASLSSIAVKEVGTRYGQEVRNHLIFLLNGGKGQPAAPQYSLGLVVVSLNEAAAVVQVARDENVPSAATVTMISTYALTDAKTGEAVASGRRQFAASYDVPLQEFAALRAQRDAENRAARELAELIRLAVAQDLAKLASQ